MGGWNGISCTESSFTVVCGVDLPKQSGIREQRSEQGPLCKSAVDTATCYGRMDFFISGWVGRGKAGSHSMAETLHAEVIHSDRASYFS